ncbi:cysteine synthase [Chloroflexota bacterium]|nr:cysteine synthase [Chloroflexota bacterium]
MAQPQRLHQGPRWRLFVLRAALQAGELGRGRVLLDSTSGNMGIAYATLAAARGIAVKLCVPENASRERIAVLRALGASLVWTDAAEGSDGAILKARELAAAEPERYFYADQYNNPASWHAHYHTTARKSLRKATARSRTWWRASELPAPWLAPAATSSNTAPTSHLWRCSRTQLSTASKDGSTWPAPSSRESMMRRCQTSRLPFRTEDALLATRRLAKEEGLFVGISAGAATVAALQLAATMQAGHIVVIFPDSGYKYLSDRMWQPQPAGL